MAHLSSNVFRLPEDQFRADLQMLRIAAVNMFADQALFEGARRQLQALDYAEIFIRFESLESFRQALSDGLKWQAQFDYEPWNGSLDALNDGFREPPSFSPSGGLVVAIDRFHLLKKADQRTADALLDIIEYQSRNHLLFGRRLIGLIRTDKFLDGAKIKRGDRWANWHHNI